MDSGKASASAKPTYTERGCRTARPRCIVDLEVLTVHAKRRSEPVLIAAEN
jgi:hypothetical protein